MDELLAAAAEAGLYVKFDNLGRRAGELRRSGLVLINHHKSALTQKVALAHEMGHWHHGHDWSAAHDVERDERQADIYAARLLIRPVDYALAERVTGPHPGALARELEVTARMVELWRDHVWRPQAWRATGSASAERHLRAV